MSKGRASVMLEMVVLNASLVSTGLLLASGIGVFMGTTSRMVVGYLPEVFDTVDLKYKVRERLVGVASHVLVSGTVIVWGIDVVFFLEVITD